jgi:hypothetical protein
MVGKSIPAIKIIKTGIYAVWANVDFTIIGAATSIIAIRFFVYTNNGKTIVLNMKESNEPADLVPV